MPSLADIESRTKTYAEAREKLSSLVSALKEGMDAMTRQQMPAIKKAVANVAEKHDQLKALIEDAPDLFNKPRTLTLHGVKVGYQKGKGGISYADAEQVVKLIHKHLPDDADTLIQVKETPIKDALANLSSSDLKRLGCEVKNSGDQVVIKPTDSEVDKMVDALIKNATDIGE